MSTGAFGHPWEQTPCFAGEPLVSTPAPMPTRRLPAQRQARADG